MPVLFIRIGWKRIFKKINSDWVEPPNYKSLFFKIKFEINTNIAMYIVATTVLIGWEIIMFTCSIPWDCDSGSGLDWTIAVNHCSGNGVNSEIELIGKNWTIELSPIVSDIAKDIDGFTTIIARVKIIIDKAVFLNRIEKRNASVK